ncbi:carbonic anhydrase [Bailinhaonella thermotolerans]|uniref:Carbonic anhydrase n=1 Tax=Bailinhaonella thermotolerans TaxID=1070861 RepID=A0A3A4AYM3_9ACTN|nr:carbonic anhydrase [Bailinhaonella thermotolerans]RJL35772.1 carbonic anhydrase [Bailinhaonella thermotolerans]
MTDDQFGRRALIRGAGLAAAGVLAGGGAAYADSAAAPYGKPPRTPRAALAALVEGNRRWVSGKVRHPHQDPQRRREVATKQEPFAVVVDCIDSRVGPELIFDAGLGDLMVVRTAAQTLDPLVTGAVEYGPAELDVPLIVVLGHQRCGAVTAAAEALHQGKRLPGNLQRIVEALRPAYTRSHGNVEQMIRVHAKDTAARLAADPLLAPRVAKGRLKVVAGYYALDTGKVSLFT